MSFERFRALASDGGVLVPVWRDCLLDGDTPVSAFAKLRRAPFAFLLESAPAGGETWARYTYMGTEPAGAWRLDDGIVQEWTPAAGWSAGRAVDDPIEDLRTRVAAYRAAHDPALGPFWGGAVGYFGYDLVRYLERLPDEPPSRAAVPDALFIFTRAVVIMDNLRAQARVVVGVPVDADADEPTLRRLYETAERDLDAIMARLRTPLALPVLDLDPGAAPAVGRSSYDRARFIADVHRIKEYIRAGDVFQTLLARRIEVPHDFSSAALYRAIRALNPSPYMYHLQLDGVELVGSSPELLVRVADDRVTVRPIAGTRPRGRTPDEDDALAAELLADPKERAEHLMLVDLGRNDVGQAAEFGSVAVTEMLKVERYSHVSHLVSQVEGQLPAGSSALGALRSTFPAGTMTGAPKVRAMQLIDELEPEGRGAYAGAVGYVAAGDARMDLAITIRTCVIAGGVASVQAGAGIVHDSVPELEWEETENKARAMLTAIGQVRMAASRPVLDGEAATRDGARRAATAAAAAVR